VDLISLEEAKKLLGKTEAELEEMRKKGDLRAFKDGPSWKFRKEDIDRLAGAAAAEKPAEGEAKAAGDTLMSIDADILFAEEEEVPADSAAETWIAADTEGVFPKGQGGEQARGVAEAMAAPETEPAPLALSPETDESSLGAVLSEEELAGAEGGEEAAIAVDTESGSAVVVPGSGTSGTAAVPSRTRIVTLVEPPAHHAEFTFMLGIAAVMLAVATLGVMSVMAGSVPNFLLSIGSESTPLIILASGVVLVLAAAGIGYILQKQRAAREAVGG